MNPRRYRRRVGNQIGLQKKLPGRGRHQLTIFQRFKKTILETHVDASIKNG